MPFSTINRTLHNHQAIHDPRNTTSFHQRPTQHHGRTSTNTCPSNEFLSPRHQECFQVLFERNEVVLFPNFSRQQIPQFRSHVGKRSIAITVQRSGFLQFHCSLWLWVLYQSCDLSRSIFVQAVVYYQQNFVDDAKSNSQPVQAPINTVKWRGERNLVFPHQPGCTVLYPLELVNGIDWESIV